MATFPIVGGSAGVTRGAPRSIAEVDTVVLAQSLIEIRDDLSSVLDSTKTGLAMKGLTLKLALTIEGKVAFIAKGSAEASIEVLFERP